MTKGDDRALILKQKIFDLLLDSQRPADCVAVYLWLLGARREQKTNKPLVAVRALSDRLKMSHSTVVATIRELERIGLVKPSYRVEDKKRKRVLELIMEGDVD